MDTHNVNVKTATTTPPERWGAIEVTDNGFVFTARQREADKTA